MQKSKFIHSHLSVFVGVLGLVRVGVVCYRVKERMCVGGMIENDEENEQSIMLHE